MERTDSSLKDFRAVIDLWPSLGDFARAVDCDYGTAKKWRSRNSIPADWDTRVVAAAKADDLDMVSFELLARLRAPEAMSA